MKRLFIILCAICFVFVVTQMADAAYIGEIESNDSFATAQNLDGAFTLDSDSDIFWSTTHWHSSVNARYSGGDPNDVDYYRFTVGQANTTGFFDTDWTQENGSVDTVIALFDSSRNVLAVSDDTVDPLDPGSTTGLDSFIGVYTFANPGTYYLAVSDFSNFPGTCGTWQDVMTRPDGVGYSYGTPTNTTYYNDLYAGDSGPTFMDTTSGYSSGDYVLHASLSSIEPIPEPATMLLLGSGLAGLAGFRRKFKKS